MYRDYKMYQRIYHLYTDGLAQDCSNSNALAMELLQSCAKPLIYDCPSAGEGEATLKNMGKL